MLVNLKVAIMPGRTWRDNGHKAPYSHCHSKLYGNYYQYLAVESNL
eukprot:COSAG02_NODE_1449_length_12567_cov_4.622474_2_plen_46_part_00